jgi:serine/threonine protein kinase
MRRGEAVLNNILNAEARMTSLLRRKESVGTDDKRRSVDKEDLDALRHSHGSHIQSHGSHIQSHHSLGPAGSHLHEHTLHRSNTTGSNATSPQPARMNSLSRSGSGSLPPPVAGAASSGAAAAAVRPRLGSGDFSLIEHPKNTSDGPYHEGYLKKKGENNPIWKRRWFVLKDLKVTYYEDQTVPTVFGSIELQECMLVRITPPSSHLHQALNLWNPNRYFQIDLPMRTYYFYADSVEDSRKWINVLNDCKNLLQRRKICCDVPPPRPVLISPGSAPTSPKLTGAYSEPASQISHPDRPLADGLRSRSSNNLLLFSQDDSALMRTDSHMKDSDWSMSSSLPGHLTMPVKQPVPARAISGDYVDIADVRQVALPPLETAVAVPPPAFLSDGSCEIDLRYIKFLEALGEGNFGKVYRSILWEKEVAVKVLKDEFSNHDLAKELENEVSVLTRLRHPNCVLFIGYSRTPQFSIVTEYMANGSLYSLIHSPSVRFTASQMIKITVEIALAMNYLHQHTPIILHRDLKTSNVLISESWTAKVSDFGLAELRGALRLPAQSGAVQWRAPEVTDTSFHAPADVFSFGMLMWELLTRKNPFDDPPVAPYEVHAMIREGKRPPMPTFDNGIQTSLIQRCWAQDPKDRPTFQAVLEYLKPLIDDDLNVVQLRSHPEVYMVSTETGEHAALKFQRKARQGFYPSLPPSARHCRVWTAMFQGDKEAEATDLFTTNFLDAARLRGMTDFTYVLLDDYCKMKGIICFSSEERLRQADDYVLSVPLQNFAQIFSQWQPTLCTPIVREKLEAVELGTGKIAKPTHARAITASFVHENSHAYEIFEELMANSPLNSVLLTDHSSGGFTLFTFFADEASMRAACCNTEVHKFVASFRDLLSSIPIIEHYRVLHSSHADVESLSQPVSPPHAAVPLRPLSASSPPPSGVPLLLPPPSALSLSHTNSPLTLSSSSMECPSPLLLQPDTAPSRPTPQPQPALNITPPTPPLLYRSAASPPPTPLPVAAPH